MPLSTEAKMTWPVPSPIAPAGAEEAGAPTAPGAEEACAPTGVPEATPAPAGAAVASAAAGAVIPTAFHIAGLENTMASRFGEAGASAKRRSNTEEAGAPTAEQRSESEKACAPTAERRDRHTHARVFGLHNLCGQGRRKTAAYGWHRKSDARARTYASTCRPCL